MSAQDGFLGSGTRETISSGKQTAGELLSAAQHKLRRVFLVFVIGLILTIYAMRAFIWPVLEADLLPKIENLQGTQPETVAITPFDVILMQAKVGLVVGIALAIPAFLYYSREPLKARGWYPKDGLATPQIGGIAAFAIALFFGGIVYSYNIFFPIMFDFLAKNANNAGLVNSYSIVYWTEFIFILAFSFGVAAQLPLLITAFSYSGIIKYETFRDNWRYAVVGMFGFGALFSPPDPFTQAMWAGPLVILYGVSLYLARLAVAFKRGGSLRGMGADVRSNISRVAGTFVLASGLGWLFFAQGVDVVNESVLPQVPANYRPSRIDVESLAPLAGDAGVLALAGIVGLVFTLAATLYYAWPSPGDGGDGEYGDPTAIDLDTLDAGGIQAAPPEAFAELEEADALTAANEAMDDGQPEKAQAILDRYDEAEAASGDGDEGSADAGEGDQGDPPPGRVERATATMFDSITDDETDPDDIGGYYHDLKFIASSLRSKVFRIFFVFIAVMVAVFYFLYSGGIGQIREDFLRRLPEAVGTSDIESVRIVVLHPVEALVFEVKISVLLGLLATLPVLLYYAWPALKERGLASGNRNVFFGWTGAMAAGLFLGSAIGYLFVAPSVISYLVWDALQADMEIAYRVSNFFWLIFFTTIGIGLLIDVPVTMILFHRGGIVSYGTLRRRWRIVVLGTLVAAGLLTPGTVLSMLLVTIPVMLAYGLGLGILWLYTIPERRTVRAAPGSG
jgi:sec-independent protein translocase protein TatC